MGSVISTGLFAGIAFDVHGPRAPEGGSCGQGFRFGGFLLSLLAIVSLFSICHGASPLGSSDG
jgi:hypothetical protein